MQCNFRDGVFTLRGQPEGPCTPSCWRHLNLLRLTCFIALALPTSLYLGKNENHHSSSQSLADLHPAKELEKLAKIREWCGLASLKLSGVPVNWLHSQSWRWGTGGHGRIGASGSPACMNEELIADCSSLLTDVHLFRLKRSAKSMVSK